MVVGRGFPETSRNGRASEEMCSVCRGVGRLSKSQESPPNVCPRQERPGDLVGLTAPQPPVTPTMSP